MTQLYWVDGPWPGKLALAARPRGGDWLEDELRDWRQAGIAAVMSLLTPSEESSLDLSQESSGAKALGMTFISLPIEDRQVPNSESEVTSALDRANAMLMSGKNLVIHCRQGVGRTGLIGACLLVSKGVDPSSAVDQLSAARGVAVPETSEQRRLIDHYAATLTTSK